MVRAVQRRIVRSGFNRGEAQPFKAKDENQLLHYVVCLNHIVKTYINMLSIVKDLICA